MNRRIAGFGPVRLILKPICRYRTGVRHSELVRCPGCGAPLKAPPDSTVHHLVTCSFCNAQVEVEPDHGPAHPSAQYGSPQPFGAPSPYGPTAPFAPRTPQRLRFNPIGIILPVVFLGVFAVPALIAGSHGGLGGLIRKFQSDPFPITCALNETIELDGKTSTRTDTLIDASQNCKIKISNCKLKGATIIRAQHNAEISIDKSNLESTGDGIETGFNAKIQLDNASVIKAAGTGIHAGANGNVQVRSASRIESQGVAVHIDANPVLTVQNSTLQGKVAFDLDVNAKVRLVNSKVIGARKMGINGRVEE